MTGPLSRWVERLRVRPQVAHALAEENPSQAVRGASFPAATVGEILHVTEVDDADFFIGDLFRRRFKTAVVPDFPRHFVAFYRNPPASVVLPMGYVHFTPWEGCHLCGGLVIDERRWRDLPAPHRGLIRGSGGVAEYMLRQAIGRVLPESIAVWGRVGDRLAEKVDLRVGFVHTGRPYLMVIWNHALSEEQRAEWVRRAEALGDF